MQSRTIPCSNALDCGSNGRKRASVPNPNSGPKAPGDQSLPKTELAAYFDTTVEPREFPGIQRLNPAGSLQATEKGDEVFPFLSRQPESEAGVVEIHCVK